MIASDSPCDVRVHIASFNTAASTELCVRTARSLAGRRFDLIVGDCGSTDGSVEMLKAFEERGWLRLETGLGRWQQDWLDDWLRRDGARYAVNVDSDVEFRDSGWLSDLYATAERTESALVCTELTQEVRNAVEPEGGRTVRLGSRPGTWLFLVDLEQIRSVKTSFGWHVEETGAVPEGRILYDPVGKFFQDFRAIGLTYSVMPPWYRRKFHHYGGLSWLSLEGPRGRKKAADLDTVRRRLIRMRKSDEGSRLLTGPRFITRWL